MAKAKEFTVTIEDKPGALRKCFLALANSGVNVLGFQSYVEEGESLARIMVDDQAAAPISLSATVGALRLPPRGRLCQPLFAAQACSKASVNSVQEP